LRSLPTRPLIYLVTDRRALRRSLAAAHLAQPDEWRAQIEVVRAAAQSGCQLIQVREKDLSARELTRFAREAVAAARPHGARVLVNDRLDVAFAADADGVHLRVNSMPAREVRRVVTAHRSAHAADFLVGVSTHSLADVVAAEAAGADFVVCGPVYAPTSKRIGGPPLGLEAFADICRRVAIPVLALGGVTAENFREPLRRGAAGVAAIGLFHEPPEVIERLVKSILATPARKE
jgi:thiamine-phosphate pyrophosphorylase